MSMSRKDYEAIASAIAAVNLSGYTDTLYRLTRLLADEFELDNPRFDRHKFEQAALKNAGQADDRPERIIDHVYDAAASWQDEEAVMTNQTDAAHDLAYILSIVWEGP